MGEHYYTQKPSAKSSEQTISICVRGVTMSLATDNGVFSKRGLDDGTRRLIEHIRLRETGHVLDLGAGYGVVTAILSQVYPQTHWTLIDLNERALGLAVRNTEFLQSRRTAILSDGIPADVRNEFDDAVLNPPIRAGKRVVYRLFADAHRALKVGGVLWVVMQKKHGAPSASTELVRLFGQLDTVQKKSSYYIFAAKKC